MKVKEICHIYQNQIHGSGQLMNDSVRTRSKSSEMKMTRRICFRFAGETDGAAMASRGKFEDGLYIQAISADTDITQLQRYNKGDWCQASTRVTKDLRPSSINPSLGEYVHVRPEGVIFRFKP